MSDPGPLPTPATPQPADGSSALSRVLKQGWRRPAAGEEPASEIRFERPGSIAMGAFVALVIFVALDALGSLRWLEWAETRPKTLIESALHVNSVGLVLAKAGVTLLVGAFLCLNRSWPLGRICLTVAVLGYAAMTLYHQHIRKVVASVEAFVAFYL